jgi:serine/threonine protein kinase
LTRGDDASFIDFISRILTYDPKKRMSASEALFHPWLFPRRKIVATTEQAEGFVATSSQKAVSSPTSQTTTETPLLQKSASESTPASGKKAGVCLLISPLYLSLLSFYLFLSIFQSFSFSFFLLSLFLSHCFSF